jgi:hypothetical protein
MYQLDANPAFANLRHYRFDLRPIGVQAKKVVLIQPSGGFFVQNKRSPPKAKTRQYARPPVLR